MNYYFKVLQNYATFSGRARRKEYWMFTLITQLVYVLAYILPTGEDSGIGTTNTIFEWTIIVMLLPGIAVAVRRAHDVGKSGWVMIIPIYNLVIALTEGEKQENKYGPDPKDNHTLIQYRSTY